MLNYLILLLTIVTLSFAEDACVIDDVENSVTKTSMQKWLDGNFGLEPYKVNYILPYGYSSRVYLSRIPSVEYKNIEAELQVSLKLAVGHNVLGLHETYYLSYSHKAFWQIYTKSAPFRESNYNPEAFIIFPIDDKKSIFNLRFFKLALAHQSNGQPDTTDVVFADGQALDNLSRSINYFYGTVRLQKSTLVADLTMWLPIPEDPKTNDNPDIMDYYGYSRVKLSYFYNKHIFTFMGRTNIGTAKGALELTYSHPLHYNNDINFYIKFFSGYGESLIDYNNKLTKFSVGFSFSR